jgi:hypothetical protein
MRGDGQKPHSQGRGLRGELAQGSQAHRYGAYTVNAALVRRQFAFLPGEICAAWLKAQGLVSVKDLWCKAQGYATLAIR